MEESQKQLSKSKRKIGTRNTMILGLIIIIILLLLRSCSSDVEFVEIEKSVYSIPVDYDSHIAEDGRVSILGWADGEQKVSLSEPYVFLKNPSGNIGRYYLQFKVYKDGIELYSSNLVEAGSMIAADFAKDMNVGTHTIEVLATAYSVNDTSKSLSAGNFEINLIVSE